MPITIDQITLETQRLAAARLALLTTVQEYQDAQQTVKDRHWPRIQKLAHETAVQHGTLFNLIDHARGLFDDPRTIIVDGIKAGLAKGKGAVEFEDEVKVIALIEKKLSEEAGIALIKTEKSLRKGALKELPAADLARIGVTIEDAGDQVLIKPVDGDVEKIIKAIVKEASEN